MPTPTHQGTVKKQTSFIYHYPTMVQSLPKGQHEFPASAPVAYPLFYRTYSRMVEGARESWEQVCQRTIQGLKELGNLTEDETALMTRMQRNVIALPSGRWMWVGGTEWVKKPENFSGAYNCLAGDTVVTTKEFGACHISELSGKRVHVVNGNSQWVAVDFQSFGEQELHEITLRRGVASGAVKTIRATSDHSWIMADGQRCPTENLKVGSYLKYQTAPRPTIDEVKHVLGIQHGIVYGDGSVQGTKDGSQSANFKVRLCKEKAELLSFFANCSHSYPESCGGDPIVYIQHHSFKDFVKEGNLKALPSTTDESYLLGFIRGLIATDGSVTGKTSPSVAIFGQLETLLWVESVAPLLGIENGTMRCLYEAGTESNFGVRKKSTYSALLYPGSMVPDDFLRTRHRKAFGNGLSNPSNWRVLDVQSLGESAEVFCCEEPDTHSFLLTGGLLTGNCTSTNVVDWRSFGLMMDLAMQGCGTGAVLEDKYISQLPVIRNRLNVVIDGEIGSARPEERHDDTVLAITGNRVIVQVGDSRQGWAESYQKLLELSSSGRFDGPVDVVVDLSAVRPSGSRLRGFGGIANPVKLPGLYGRCAAILNKAIGRKLNAVECCLLIDEAAAVVVAGNVRRCLPEDALVHTDHGLVPIKDVQVGDMVQTPLGFRRVANKFDQGVQDVYEIDTNGPIPRATLGHRVAVLKSATGEHEWKHVAELTPGDRLLHSTQILSGASTILPPDFTADRPQQSRTAKDMVVPALTPDVAWMIGYTHGNGYVSMGRNKHGKPFGSVSWSMNALSDITPAIQSKLEKVVSAFGLTVSHTFVKGENTAVTRCQSIRMAEYFHRYIKQPNTSMDVPPFILQGSIDVRAAYLAGLMDSDGSANNRPPHLLTTVYRDFARQVAAVLSSLGIAGRTSMTAPQKESWRVRHHVTIPALKGDYNNLIAPHSIKGRLHQGQKTHGFTIPGPMMRETYTYSEMQGMGFQGARTVASNYERYRAESDVQMDIPVTVKGIGSYTSIQTYDIEVEEAHCFYCDGYLTHNSAGMRQFDSFDGAAATAKDNLWQQDSEGNWRIDPERDALRMANHTRVFHQKPSLEDCQASVAKQFWSGEGAIQWAGEAIARSNADILNTLEKKREFLAQYQQGKGAEYLGTLMEDSPTFEDELGHRLQRYSLNPCAEIIGSNFFCNLSEVHLNQIDPSDFQAQEDAFKSAGTSVAVLLNQQFTEPRYRQAREFDPIVGVSFTGLFDFFVNAFGVDWLRWWEAGRPNNWGDDILWTPLGEKFSQSNSDLLLQSEYFRLREQEYLTRWRHIAHQSVWDYCDRHGLKRPNRCTTVQPAGSKSLLTGASPGWHPPKAQRFIRRVTFRKDDPVALACIDYGYTVVPSQSDKDEHGNLLNDPFDSRCTEWLVEIPVEVPWANLPGADAIHIERFSVAAQFDFYMQVQQHYTTHNTSATLEMREGEIDTLAGLIYNAIQNDEGYISAAILARFDDTQTFPRLPFEPIDKATYDALSEAVLQRRVTDDFHQALAKYDAGELVEAGPAGCDSDKCMMPEKKP